MCCKRVGMFHMCFVCSNCMFICIDVRSSDHHCTQHVPSLYQFGIELVHHIGTKLVPPWFHTFTKPIPAWYHRGTNLLPTWTCYHVGALLLSTWYKFSTSLALSSQLGTNFVTSPYERCTKFAPTAHQLRTDFVPTVYNLCTIAWQLCDNFVPTVYPKQAPQ